MGRSRSSPGFSENEVPTRAGAVRWPAEEPGGKGAAQARALQGPAEVETTSVPVAVLEAALAESREGREALRVRKSGLVKKVDREAFSVHEADTKPTSGLALAPAPEPVAPLPIEAKRAAFAAATDEPAVVPMKRLGGAAKAALVLVILLAVLGAALTALTLR